MLEFLKESVSEINKTLEQKCLWVLVDKKDGEWKTECNQTLNLPDNLIGDCCFIKCPYCGKEMLVIEQKEDEDDNDDDLDGCDSAHAEKEDRL